MNEELILKDIFRNMENIIYPKKVKATKKFKINVR